MESYLAPGGIKHKYLYLKVEDVHSLSLSFLSFTMFQVDSQKYTYRGYILLTNQA